MKRQTVWGLSAIGIALILGASAVARAEDDPKQLYDVSFQASPKVKTGAAGAVSIKITPKNGGELHDETPLSMDVKGPDAIAFAKAKYGRADAKVTPTDTSLSAAFTGKSAGSGDVEAAVSFVICNASNCFRQSIKRTAKVAVE